MGLNTHAQSCGVSIAADLGCRTSGGLARRAGSCACVQYHRVRTISLGLTIHVCGRFGSAKSRTAVKVLTAAQGTLLPPRVDPSRTLIVPHISQEASPATVRLPEHSPKQRWH